MVRAGKYAINVLAIAAAWGLFALFAASQNYLSRAYNPCVLWKPAFQYSLVDSAAWALLTPLIFYVAGVLVVKRRNLLWTVPLLTVSSLGFALLHLVIFIRLLPLIGYRTNPGLMQYLAVFGART